MNLYAKISEPAFIKPLYEGSETDTVIVTVDNASRTISANLNQNLLDKINDKYIDENELKASIVEISSNIGSISNDTDKMKEEIVAINSNIETIDTNIEDIHSQIVTINNSLIEEGKVINDKFSEVDKVLSTNISDIEELESSLNSNIRTIEADIEEISSKLIELDSTLSDSNKAAEAKVVGDQLSEVRGRLVEIEDLLTETPAYGYKYYHIDPEDQISANRTGYYVGQNGVKTASTSYSYTEPFEVLPGDIIHLTGYSETSGYIDKKYDMRFGCAYNANNSVITSNGFGSFPNKSLQTFEIKEGTAKIVVTYSHSAIEANNVIPVFARYTTVSTRYILKDSSNSKAVIDALNDISRIKEDIEQIKSQLALLDIDKIENILTDLNNIDVNKLSIVTNSTLRSSRLFATAETLMSGDILQLENNSVSKNKSMTFNCKLDEAGLGEGRITIGHGKRNYGANYLTIDRDNITIYYYSSFEKPLLSIPHNLNIKDYLNISIACEDSYAKIKLSTSTGVFKTGNSWYGRNGYIFAEVDNCSLKDVKLSWFCKDYQNPIWLVGDSYISPTSTGTSRWTNYMLADHYDKCLLLGFPGMDSARGLSEVKQALLHGHPQYIIWCLGMNDEDSANNIDPSYESATQEFLNICEEKGIIPILSTIPSTPRVFNEYKNEWIRNWSIATNGRYIDFASAVCDGIYNEALKNNIIHNSNPESTLNNITGYSWYDDMLYSDGVHPADLGAEALYIQALTDFPELMYTN